MAHLTDGPGEAGPEKRPDTRWGVRVDGELGETDVTAERVVESPGGGDGPRSYIFYDADGRDVFRVPRERVIYIRRKP